MWLFSALEKDGKKKTEKNGDKKKERKKECKRERKKERKNMIIITTSFYLAKSMPAILKDNTGPLTFFGSDPCAPL